MILKCPSNFVLSVISANFGRTVKAGICPHQYMNNDNCYASKSLFIVKQKCGGKTLCSINAKRDIFGDPCPGIYKYLEVNFRCEPKEGNINHNII